LTAPGQAPDKCIIVERGGTGFDLNQTSEAILATRMNREAALRQRLGRAIPGNA
jgi:hypothetical protein